MLLLILEWGGVAFGLTGTALIGWSTGRSIAGWLCIMSSSMMYLALFTFTGMWGMVLGGVVYTILETMGLIKCIKRRKEDGHTSKVS